MKPIATTVGLVTLYVFFYAITPHIAAIPDRVTIAMGLFSPILLLYMVFVILKKGQPSGRTFDEGYWYDDHDKMTND